MWKNGRSVSVVVVSVSANRSDSGLARDPPRITLLNEEKPKGVRAGVRSRVSKFPLTAADGKVGRGVALLRNCPPVASRHVSLARRAFVIVQGGGDTRKRSGDANARNW